MEQVNTNYLNMCGFQMKPIERSETVSVAVNNVSATQFKFSDNEIMLDNALVTGIVIHSASVSKDFCGATILADAIQKKAFLTLCNSKGVQLLKRLPLETFFNDQRMMIELNDLPVDTRKSFIDIQDRTGITSGEVFVITFFYKTK